MDNLDKNSRFGYAICQDPQFFGKLQLFRIINPGSTCPTLAGPFEINVMQTFVNAFDMTTHISFPTLLYGDLGKLDINDDRLADSSHIRNKQIYTCHTIFTDHTGNAASPAQGGDRNSIRWYQIDVTGDPTGRGRCKEHCDTIPALVQAGTIFDNRIIADPLNYWVPAIVSNDQGDIIIAGSVASSMSQPISAFYVGKAGNEPKDGTMHIGSPPPNTYFMGSGHFTHILGGASPNGQRWGDMSFGNLDPADRKTMWTIQEITINGLETNVVAQIAAAPLV